MGLYVNMLPDGTPLSHFGKANAILTIVGAKEIYEPPSSFDKIPSGMALIAVKTSNFEAALYIDDENQFARVVTSSNLGVRWILIDKDIAKQIAK